MMRSENFLVGVIIGDESVRRTRCKMG